MPVCPPEEQVPTMLNLSRFKPRFWDHQDAASGPGSSHFSFRRKWLMIVTFTTVVTLTPLLIMTLVDYRLTRQAFESEATMGIARMVSNTWRKCLVFAVPAPGSPRIRRPGQQPAELLAPGRLDGHPGESAGRYGRLRGSRRGGYGLHRPGLCRACSGLEEAG